MLNQHVGELFDLDRSLRQRFVEDANHVAQALNKTFLPLKMNYFLLGNTLCHLHWHLIPRRDTDPTPKRPVWEDPIPHIQLSDDEFRRLAADIRANL